jgi:hypothetical protein
MNKKVFDKDFGIVDEKLLEQLKKNKMNSKSSNSSKNSDSFKNKKKKPNEFKFVKLIPYLLLTIIIGLLYLKYFSNFFL